MKETILKTLKGVRDPSSVLYRLFGKSVEVEPVTPLLQEKLFLEYGHLARTQGFDRLYVTLSFDCDTPEDISAAGYIHTWLSERGLKATYAVPGAQLIEGANTYQRIFDMGADFINHGALPHAEWRDGRYWSITFYNEMTTEEVIEDLKNGHEICRKVLNYSPVGFRAPHFGYFQAPKQREVLYTALRELGYEYSTSTLPEYGLKHGPVVKEKEIKEIPLSGSYVDPFTILDSWNYVVSPNEPELKPQYADLFVQTVDKLLALEVPGVLNYYVDPAHVFKGNVFYQAMDHLLSRGVETLYFREVLEIARNQ